MSLKKIRQPSLLTERNQTAKSLRKFVKNSSRSHLKTSIVQLNPQCMINRAQQQLSECGISSSFLRNLYQKRCHQNQMKPQQDKYQIFTKHFLNKFNKTFNLSQLKLKEDSLSYFLKQIAQNDKIIGINISNIRFSDIEQIMELIGSNTNLCKLHLCNISLEPKDFKIVLNKITEMNSIIYLDLSNKTFQGSNKLGESYKYLSKFIETNKIIQILDLQGLSIKDKGLESIIQGFKNKQSNIVSLNLKNNGFSRNGYFYIRQIIINTRLQELNLSDNRLGSYGINHLQILKQSNISKLNLTNTDLQSQGLYNLFNIIRDNKSLSHLILDKNNFDNHWFKRIEDNLTNNKSLKILSMNSCHIKYPDSLFKSLCQNYVLQRLQISNNSLQNHMQSFIEFIKRNKTLKQLKLKQCQIDNTKIVQFFKSLYYNGSITSVDLSYNSIGINLGKEILRQISINSSLIFLNLQKTEIDLSIKLLIQTKISNNKKQHEAHIKNILKKQISLLRNKQIKNINLTSLKQTLNNNLQSLKSIKSSVKDLNNQILTKAEQKSASLNQYNNQLAKLNKQLIDMEHKAKPIFKQLNLQKQQLNQQIKQLNSLKEKQLTVIKKLQKELQLQRNNIKILQNKLQKQYDNQKYINKRNNNSNSLVKLPFIHQVSHPTIKPKALKATWKEIKNSGKVDVRSKN